MKINYIKTMVELKIHPFDLSYEEIAHHRVNKCDQCNMYRESSQVISKDQGVTRSLK